MGSDQSSAVRAGIFVLLCGILLVGVIVVLGQSSQLFTRQYTLWTHFRNAYGLIAGADVRLAGVTAGGVRGVRIVTDDKGEKVVRVEMDIIYAYKPMITSASRAYIRTLGPLGDKYVEILFEASEKQSPPGQSAQPVELQPGDYIQSEETEDFYEIARKARETLEQASRIAGQVTTALTEFENQKVVQSIGASAESLRKIIKEAETGSGLLHAIIYDKELANVLDEFKRTRVIEDVSRSAKSIRRIIEKVENGSGLLHKVVYDEELPDILADLRKISKSLRTSAERIESGKGALGRLIHGDKLEQALSDLAVASARTQRILKQIEEGDSTAHALIYGSKERESLEEFVEVARRLNRILTDVQQGKGTLGLLIADPEVWESIKRVLGDTEKSRTLKFLIRRRAAEEKKGNAK